MAASFEGYGDIVRMLIKANAQINTQDEVHILFYHHTAQHIFPHSVKYSSRCGTIYELIVCISIHRVVLLLFIWQHWKEILML